MAAVGGVKIRELEDTISCVLQILGEDGAKGDAILAKSLARVQSVALTQPTSKTCLLIVACMCGLELFASAAKEPAAKFAEKVPKYYSYCSTELRLIKRDLPKPLVQKIDKCLQDISWQRSMLSVSRVQIHAMPPRRMPSRSRARCRHRRAQL